jgi:hypothetical protein
MSGIIGVSPDMRSGVVGKYPAGNVVQCVQSGNGYGTFTNTSYTWGQYINTEVVPSPKGGNKLFCLSTNIGYLDNDPSYFYIGFHVGDASTMIGSDVPIYDNDADDYGFGGSLQASYTVPAGNTSDITIRTLPKCYTGTGHVVWDGIMTIWEIQQ